MEFSAFIQWGFLGLLSGAVAILYKMAQSMNELNIKLAVFVERVDNHQDQLSKIETRLESIEKITYHCEVHKSK